eukprot:12412307-Karenia_brevis.AAC.1
MKPQDHGKCRGKGGKIQAHVASKQVEEPPEAEQSESDQSKHESPTREGKVPIKDTNSDVDDLF